MIGDAPRTLYQNLRGGKGPVFDRIRGHRDFQPIVQQLYQKLDGDGLIRK
ncbi:MAG: hypothetical protein AAF492_31765 [Verrucomicrobiota bacterium]